MNMDDKNVDRGKGSNELAPPAHSVVAVAISGSTKSKYILNWALEKFVPEGLMYFKLLHVRPLISRIPSPTTEGNYIPISQVQEDVAAAFRKDVECQVNEKFLPYKRICSQRKVQVEIVQIESGDVGTAIGGYIQKHKIIKLVIGSSSSSMFSSARPLSSKIPKCCPAFCRVYAVSKGKLLSMHRSDSATNRNFDDNCSETETSCSTDNSSSLSSSTQTDWTVKDSFSKSHSPSLPEQRFQALSGMNQILPNQRMHSNEAMHPRNSSVDTNDSDLNYPNGLDLSYATKQADPSFTKSMTQTPRVQTPTSGTSSVNQANINLELENLRIELRHVRGMYAMAQGEAIDASRKLNELEKCHLVEEIKLKRISFKEEEAEELARQEKKRYEAAKKEADYVKECTEREAVERKEAEITASRETKEKENLESSLNGCVNQYRQFTWEEIESGTSSFSDSLKIGMGAYGTVYRCSFQHTTAAVKILHAKEASRNKQFQQELEIMSQIHHPHLLILLGACSERSCLVYEYMENGSLEDLLTRKNNTPPLLWFDRFRIAWEVASALVFLHEAKPKYIIHRDLKPANILLDRNYVSKIGDVGLSTMVSQDPLSLSATFSNNGLVGTLCYIDPEYQRTGVISSKSDVYAFGMIMLQLLTAKTAIGLTHVMENAINNDRLMEVLDLGGGRWPSEETKDLAVLGLKCTELRQRDRPGLRDEVLPALERLKDFAERARDLELASAPVAPKHFTCPIVNEVMNDPSVAADGYTYDRRAIEAWIKHNDTSPVTGLRFVHKYLTPNYTLLSAIMEWKSGKET